VLAFCFSMHLAKKENNPNISVFPIKPCKPFVLVMIIRIIKRCVQFSVGLWYKVLISENMSKCLVWLF
jgi:hypothetical protein